MAKKKPPAYLFALGKATLPDPLVVEGVTWRLHTLYKHDFFAATALYQAPGLHPVSTDDGIHPPFAVLKIQRTHHFFGFPLRWLGRFVANHEIRVYRALQDIPGIPAFLGRVDDTGFLHAYVPGTELTPDMAFTPLFFDQLYDMLVALHARDIAYVDTNKRENILMGEDGRPWLIDFQISYQQWPGMWDNWVTRTWLRRLQRADWYHFYKHKTRLMPEGCTPEDFARAGQRGFLHNLHRVISRPLITMRRRFLSRYKLEKVK